jgi:hypothetical protein
MDGGENAIILFAGANRRVTRDDVEKVLNGSYCDRAFGKGDWLLLQNEMSAAGDALVLAKRRGKLQM